MAGCAISSRGLWVAAEEAEKYTAALGTAFLADNTAECAAKPCEAQLQIVRRMLRYRGAADVAQTAGRYGLPFSLAEAILEELCSRKEAVRQNGKILSCRIIPPRLYTDFKNRRNEAQTCPASLCGAAAVPHGVQCACKGGAAGSFKVLCGNYTSCFLLGGYPFPRWVKQYKETVLDAYLAEGGVLVHTGKGGLRFELQEGLTGTRRRTVC